MNANGINERERTMAIEAGLRGALAEGTKLVARYKGQEYAATVVTVDGATRYRLDDGRAYKTPSAAGSGITGTATNGWRFWSAAE